MLTGSKIHESVLEGVIRCEPSPHYGPNSIDLRLANELVVVCPNGFPIPSTSNPSKVKHKKCRKHGFILWPGRVYLGRTIEYIGSNDYVPMVHGRSSVGRHGIAVHVTAGFGDLSWFGCMVLEIVNHNWFPTYIKPGVRICQIEWSEVTGPKHGYNSTYQNQTGIVPAKALT